MSDGDVRYRFLSVLGEGGFGKVYHARMEASGGFHKDVAVKVLHDANPPRSLIQRHRDEARILGLIRDRTIVGVEPPIQIGSQWAIVMEYVEGVSCGALIHQSPLPPGVCIEVVGEVARALHNVYQMEGPEGGPLQLLHRDIKPDNIQITPAGEIRLLDFGIARANFLAREFKTRHSLGGTPGYIAPERLHGIEGPAGDVYSLGVVLHELVTGRRPALPTTLHVEEGDPANLVEPAEENPESGSADLTFEPLEATFEPLTPEIAEVLKLAGWMRADEPGARPTAREVEKECRRLRHAFAPPYLRDWAEESVPHRTPIQADDMIGRVLTGHTASQLATTPEPSPSLPPFHDNRLAVGAVVGGGMVAAIGLLLAVVGVVVLVAWQWSQPIATAEVHAPAPVVTPLTPVPAADPVPEPVITAAPVPTEQPAPVPGPGPISAAVLPPSVPGPRAAPVAPASTAPVTPVAPPAATFMVTFTSLPLGAEVLLVDSGESLGLTPVRRPLPSGNLRVRMTTHDGRAGESTIRVGRTMPTRYTWKSAEDRWESGY